MDFSPESFLLTNRAAIDLYHEVARDLPIDDFHNHLSPEEIALNRPHVNLHELWLEHDHYKWRAMRAAGIPERFITGEATPYEKFSAWAATVPQLLRNPLFDWNRLELWMFFGITTPLNPATCAAIWEETSRQLANRPLTPSLIFEQCRVASLGTTDDPADSLHWHQQCQQRARLPIVTPTFRPDLALHLNQREIYQPWLARLAKQVGHPIRSLDDLLAALHQRHDQFHECGCRYSDHGLARLFFAEPDRARAGKIFEQALSGALIEPADLDRWGAFLMDWLAGLDAARGWTKQLHLGPLRNNSTILLRDCGPDAGADSIGDWSQVGPLQLFLNRLQVTGKLPDLIVYPLNPAELYPIATMLGNFNSGPSETGLRRIRLRLGAAWWFLDHRAGIRQVINVVSQTGLLSDFPGMVTDSRSFLSFSRHDYYRRIICDQLGSEIEAGLLPEAPTRELLARLCRSPVPSAQQVPGGART